MLLGHLLAAVAGLLPVSANNGGGDDLDTLLQRRRVDMAGFATGPVLANIPQWLDSQTANGTWPDVDYRLGCAAQRANWPIQQHWIRVIALAAAWSGLNPDAPKESANDTKLLDAALKGMDWWFERDFTNPACMSQGGKDACPCTTPGTWNTNWFGQVILIPQLASTACLIVMPANLTDLQKQKCREIPARAYALRDVQIPGIGALTGANMVNVMQNSLSMALLDKNASVVSDAFERAMGSYLFADNTTEDGIHRDGSFLQHNGITYNGNYGKDSLNAFIQLEGEAIGTSYAANDSVREAVAALVRGDEWMIYVDEETGQEHWDFNVIGRFVAFHTSDLQASADIMFNTSKLGAAVADFAGDLNLNATVDRLKSNGTNKLTGNKVFWASDYMIHRRDEYILTNKMLSKRTVNTEWANSANPLGYHMGQGTLYSYVTGTEYKDLQNAWDWYLVPGTTTLLHAPPLDPKVVAVSGNKTYVGVVSDGQVGASAMDYIDPAYNTLAFRKAWFFFDDSVLVTTTGVTVDRTKPNVTDEPVVTVLNQRSAADGGNALVDGKTVQLTTDALNVSAKTLMYAGNGYLSHGTPFNLTLAAGSRSGNWSAISTSTAGVKSVDIFSAYTTVPNGTYTYQFFPKISPETLDAEAKSPSITPLDLGGVLGAAGKSRLALVFWPTSPLTASVPHKTCGWEDAGELRVTVDAPVALLFKTEKKPKGHGKAKTRHLVITVADPNQSLSTVKITVESTTKPLKCADGSKGKQNGKAVELDVSLPTGGMQGSSVSVAVEF